MPVVHSPDSELGKELAKWEQHPTKFTSDENRPGNPYQYRPYPKAIYRAVKDAGGKIVCMPGEPNPALFLDTNAYNFAVRQQQALEQQCFRTVGNDEEWERAKRDGWRESPTDAIAYFEALERDIANAAAERHFTDQRLSEKARAEAKAADDATAEHVPDIPRKKPRD